MRAPAGRTVTFILNEKAGAEPAEGIRELIERAAAERGLKAEVRALAAEDLEALSKQAREAGGLVVAGGGDGTVSAVAAAVAGTEATLGVLPMGTLNHFAKDLGLPLDLEGAVRTVFDGRAARVDVGEVNGRIFVNNSSVGFYPQIVLERERAERQGQGKWAALARATASAVRRSKTLEVVLENEGRPGRAFRTALVFVGNNRYEVSGLEIGTRKALDAGTLWVCTAPDAGRFALLKVAFLSVLGVTDGRALVTSELEEFWVRPRHRHLLVATDGEVVRMETPLHYRIRPGDLRVMVPAEAEGS